MRIATCILLFLFGFTIGIKAQSVKIPIEKEGGHIFSQWTLNNSVQANVFLESGFPKVVFSHSFVEQNMATLDVKLEEPYEDIYISFWSGNEKYKVLYTINDTISVSGIKLGIDALVVNTDKIPTWGSRDILFPIADMQKRIELNIGEGYMRILDDLYKIPEEYISFDVSKDKFTKGLYHTTTLRAYDADGGAEEISGNFQLDLGAGNAFMLNKNQPEVVDFFSAADRMVLKDTTQFKGPKNIALAVIIPDRIQLGNIEVKDNFIVGLKYRGNRSDLYIGNIGPSFFQNFIIIFDFENSKFYLKPISDKVRIKE